MTAVLQYVLRKTSKLANPSASHTEFIHDFRGKKTQAKLYIYIYLMLQNLHNKIHLHQFHQKQ